MRPIFEEMISFPGLGYLSHFPNLLFLAEVLALLWLAKRAFGFFCPYDLEEQLVRHDNKAVTLNFVGYLAGVALIVEGVLESPSPSLAWGLISVAIWGLVGIMLLLVAGRLNDRFILRGINAHQAMLKEGNLAVAVVEGASYLGSAALIRAIVMGESLGWAMDLGLTLFYFVLGQLAFWLYALLYQKLTSYDDLAEIAAGNAAAGLTLGANLAAMGFLMAMPLKQSYSLPWFVAWFVLGNATLAAFRWAMDRLVISSEKLDQEIYRDKNWGVAILEGAFSVSAVLILQNLFG
ncbi:MAG: DUF350 domain-containing protein [bacterium]|nr:DUF350 domain-containing protein [bacterium]